MTSPGDPDQDGDERPDHCDNCPGVYNPGQENTGEAVPDEVGDACDPRPTEGGDRIVHLETFESPDSFGSNWTSFECRRGWSIDSDGLVFEEANEYCWFAWNGATGDNLAMELHFSVISESDKRTSNVGIAWGLDDQGNGLDCMAGADDWLYLYSLREGYVPAGEFRDWHDRRDLPRGAFGNGRQVLRAGSWQGQQHCMYDPHGVAPISLDPPTIPLDAGRIAFRFNNVVARVHMAVIYQLP
jgi:hypothetical protein